MYNNFLSEPKAIIDHETGHYNNRVSFTAADDIELGDFISKDNKPVKIDLTQTVAALSTAFESVIGIALDNYKKGEKAVAVDGKYDDTLFNSEAIKDLAPLFADIDAVDRKADDDKILILNNAIRSLSIIGYETTKVNRQTMKVETPWSNDVPDNTLPMDNNVIHNDTIQHIKPIHGMPKPATHAKPDITVTGITNANKNGKQWIAKAGETVQINVDVKNTQGQGFDIVIKKGTELIGETTGIISDGSQTVTASISAANPKFKVLFNGSKASDQKYDVEIHETGKRNAPVTTTKFNVIVQGKFEDVTPWDATKVVNLDKTLPNGILLASGDWSFNGDYINKPIRYTVKAGGVDISPTDKLITSNTGDLKYSSLLLDDKKMTTGSDITISFHDTEKLPLTNAITTRTLKIGTVTI